MTSEKVEQKGKEDATAGLPDLIRLHGRSTDPRADFPSTTVKTRPSPFKSLQA